MSTPADVEELHALERRIDQLEEALRMTRGTVEGTKVRIDRLLGTIDDLLKRFEAWKEIGNEMGETVEAMQAVQGNHEGLWEQQQKANKLVERFMEETEAMLKRALDQLH
jgi:uncharacterized coiled-coil DUF342 family protein